MPRTHTAKSSPKKLCEEASACRCMNILPNARRRASIPSCFVLWPVLGTTSSYTRSFSCRSFRPLSHQATGQAKGANKQLCRMKQTLVSKLGSKALAILSVRGFIFWQALLGGAKSKGGGWASQGQFVD